MSFDPGAQEIVIDENVDNVLHSGALWERLQDPSLGEGTITPPTDGGLAAGQLSV